MSRGSNATAVLSINFPYFMPQQWVLVRKFLQTAEVAFAAPLDVKAFPLVTNLANCAFPPADSGAALQHTCPRCVRMFHSRSLSVCSFELNRAGFSGGSGKPGSIHCVALRRWMANVELPERMQIKGN